MLHILLSFGQSASKAAAHGRDLPLDLDCDTYSDTFSIPKFSEFHNIRLNGQLVLYSRPALLTVSTSQYGHLGICKSFVPANRYRIKVGRRNGRWDQKNKYLGIPHDRHLSWRMGMPALLQTHCCGIISWLVKSQGRSAECMDAFRSLDTSSISY